MEFLEKLSVFFGKWMALIVIAVAALALFAPQTCLWIKTSWINWLLGIVMFGMGLTLKMSDFKVVFSRPKDIIIGFIAQFTLMPLIAFVLTKTFQSADGNRRRRYPRGHLSRRYVVERDDLSFKG